MNLQNIKLLSRMYIHKKVYCTVYNILTLDVISIASVQGISVDSAARKASGGGLCSVTSVILWFFFSIVEHTFQSTDTIGSSETKYVQHKKSYSNKRKKIMTLKFKLNHKTSQPPSLSQKLKISIFNLIWKTIYSKQVYIHYVVV